MTLRDIRIAKMLTQRQAAEFLGVPLRTYSNYELDASKQSGIKYKYMIETLSKYGFIDEENGILTVDEIRKICAEVFAVYPVEYCYLFGSYAKGLQTPTSDIDLYVSTTVSGLQFFGLIEELREKLKKKIDLIDQRQLQNNFDLTNEILKDGIKIYG